MTIKPIHKKILIPFVLSLFMHFSTFKLLDLLPKEFFPRFKSIPLKNQKPLQVSNIQRVEMPKYRTVGIKKGKKTFSLPVKNKPAPKQKTKPEKSMSLKSLQPKTKKSHSPSNNEAKVLVKKAPQKKKFEVTTNSSVNQQDSREVQMDVLKQLANSPENKKILHKTGFNMKFEPPEGVNEDELNTMEKIFYSFQKRIFQKYVGSFLKTYKQTLLNRPSINETLQEDKHRLTARVIFDAEGNIVRIKILRSSVSDDVHNLFEETLKEIHQIPNPPRDILGKNRNFTIYYQLNIN